MPSDGTHSPPEEPTNDDWYLGEAEAKARLHETISNARWRIITGSFDDTHNTNLYMSAVEAADDTYGEAIMAERMTQKEMAHEVTMVEKALVEAAAVDPKNYKLAGMEEHKASLYGRYNRSPSGNSEGSFSGYLLYRSHLDRVYSGFYDDIHTKLEEFVKEPPTAESLAVFQTQVSDAVAPLQRQIDLVTSSFDAFLDGKDQEFRRRLAAVSPTSVATSDFVPMSP
ncbi:hypothetical protein Q8F55_008534 [Vanrija albida]|uniref:Uncharacterized protein n=1 Tax=Vanrija albida TaxID=181172 RepID=A0ABR3PR41_9TREE